MLVRACFDMGPFASGMASRKHIAGDKRNTGTERLATAHSASTESENRSDRIFLPMMSYKPSTALPFAIAGLFHDSQWHGTTCNSGALDGSL
jgi:hypothetical protein